MSWSIGVGGETNDNRIRLTLSTRLRWVREKEHFDEKHVPTHVLNVQCAVDDDDDTTFFVFFCVVIKLNNTQKIN